MTNDFLCVTENKVPHWEPCAISWFFWPWQWQSEGKESTLLNRPQTVPPLALRTERAYWAWRRMFTRSWQVLALAPGILSTPTHNWFGIKKKAGVCVAVRSRVYNSRECAINAICFRKERTCFNPMSDASHLTLMTPNTNLNFSKAPGNQFVLEMLRPLRPPFDSFQISID